MDTLVQTVKQVLKQPPNSELSRGKVNIILVTVLMGGGGGGLRALIDYRLKNMLDKTEKNPNNPHSTPAASMAWLILSQVVGCPVTESYLV